MMHVMELFAEGDLTVEAVAEKNDDDFRENDDWV